MCTVHPVPRDVPRESDGSPRGVDFGLHRLSVTIVVPGEVVIGMPPLRNRAKTVIQVSTACNRRAEVPTQRSLFAHASEFRLVHIQHDRHGAHE
jgi:hypothetical protein